MIKNKIDAPPTPDVLSEKRANSSNFYNNMLELNANLGLPAQVADIEQIRRKLGQDKMILIGHSFGGFLAALYAIEFPDRVESLVLVSPADVVKIPSETGDKIEL